MKTKLKLKPSNIQPLETDILHYVSKGVNQIDYVVKDITTNVAKSFQTSLKDVTAKDLKNCQLYNTFMKEVKTLNRSDILDQLNALRKQPYNPNTFGHFFLNTQCDDILEYKNNSVNTTVMRSGPTLYAVDVLNLSPQDRQYLTSTGVKQLTDIRTSQTTPLTVEPIPTQPVAPVRPTQPVVTRSTTTANTNMNWLAIIIFLLVVIILALIFTSWVRRSRS